MADSCDFGKLLNTPSDKLLYARQTGRKNIKMLDANLQYILLRRAKLLEEKDNVFAICFHHEQFSGKVFESKADKCCSILTKDPNRYKKVRTFFKKEEKLTTNKKMLMLIAILERRKTVYMARITQNRQIAVFSLWSFNQSEAGKRKKRMQKYLFNEKKNIMIGKA